MKVFNSYKGLLIMGIYRNIRLKFIQNFLQPLFNYHHRSMECCRILQTFLQNPLPKDLFIGSHYLVCKTNLEVRHPIIVREEIYISTC